MLVTLDPSAVAAARKRERKSCAECGQPIEGLRIRRYCRQRCTQRAYRRRLTQKSHPEPRHAVY